MTRLVSIVTVFLFISSANMLGALEHELVRCCGLHYEALRHGYAITDNGIVFARDIANYSLFYEHIPFGNPDLRLITMTDEDVYIFDIRGSNNYAVYADSCYSICEPTYGRIMNRTPIMGTVSSIYTWEKDLVFFCLDDEMRLNAIKLLTEQGNLRDLTAYFICPGSELLCATVFYGRIIVLTETGVVTFDGTSVVLYHLPNGVLLDAETVLIATDNNLFLASGSTVSRITLSDEEDEVVVLETHDVQTVVPDPTVFDIFSVSDRVIIDLGVELRDWRTGDEIIGCDSALQYIQVGDSLYGIQDTPILAPYR